MSDHSHYLIGPDDGNVLYPEERHTEKAARPISVAAAEHLANVETERDALIEEVTGLEWSLNRLTIAAVDAIRFLGGKVDPDDEYGLPGALVAAAELTGGTITRTGEQPNPKGHTMSLVTCSRCGNSFDPELKSRTYRMASNLPGVASNFTRNPPPISVAAAEHLAKVETERDELLTALADERDINEELCGEVVKLAKVEVERDDLLTALRSVMFTINPTRCTHRAHDACTDCRNAWDFARRTLDRNLLGEP